MPLQNCKLSKGIPSFKGLHWRSPGVYAITHVPSGTRYIGCSEDLQDRLKSHLAALKSNRHKNKALQRAWNHDGAKAFTYSVLMFVDHIFMFQAEQYFISTSTTPLFNVAGVVSRKKT